MNPIVSHILVALPGVLLLFYIIFTKKRNEEKYGKYQDKILKMQMEEVNSIYMTMRGWRHDYHNHMQKIKAHIALGQIDEVEKYLAELETDLDKIDVKYKTGNVNIDAILNSKLSVAEKLDININCKVQLPKLDKDYKPTVSNIDMCVVIGNLIDNAIEACEKLENVDDRFMRIYMCVMKHGSKPCNVGN